jgi:hypothetical protein
MMNGEMVVEQARAMAARIRKEVGADPHAQFVRAWLLAFCRPPNDAETQAGIAFLAQQAEQLAADAPAESKPPADHSAETALAHLCHALVISNEFLYVD